MDRQTDKQHQKHNFDNNFGFVNNLPATVTRDRTGSCAIVGLPFFCDQYIICSQVYLRRIIYLPRRQDLSSQETKSKRRQTMQAPRSTPPNYLGWSIFTTLCCCLPLGIAALIFSNQVDTAIAIGDATKAADSSQKAKTFNIVGLVTGIIFLIAVIAIYSAQINALMKMKTDSSRMPY